MKKVARLRIPADEAYQPLMASNTTSASASALGVSGRDSGSMAGSAASHGSGGGGVGSGTVESVSVRTTGRIKKPKAVFDPSDNYLPRAHRSSGGGSAVPTAPVVPPALLHSGSAAPATASYGSAAAIERRKSLTSLLQQQQQQQIQQLQQKQQQQQQQQRSEHATETNQASGFVGLKKLNRLSSSSTAASSVTGHEEASPSTAPVGSTVAAASSATLLVAAPADVCMVCQKREAKRGTHAKNKLIACLDCDKKVHMLCLKMDFEDMDRLRQQMKCDNCRMCELCETFADTDSKGANAELVTCSKCVKSYHPTCHIPNVLPYQQQQRNWKCNKCTVPVSVLAEQAICEIIGGKALTLNRKTPSQLQQQPEQQQPQQSMQAVNIDAAAAEAKQNSMAAALKRSQAKQQLPNGGSEHKRPKVESSPEADNKSAVAVDGGGIANSTNHLLRYSPSEPAELPDVKDWSVEQVADYFAKYFPKEAYVFRDQEIDGMSLLLLKRSDVIKKLPIKLGPSLRIYSLILKIQTQQNDPTLGWHCGL